MPIKQMEKKEQNKTTFKLDEGKFTIDELIISEDVKNQLLTLIAAPKCWSKVFEEWNFQSVPGQKNRKGIYACFYGAPGTGKTMAANAVANAIGKKVIFVNYADIESKFVGETGKNLDALFNFAEENDAIIFFDEADALLSKRVTNMSNSTDRSANETSSQLLTILNNFSGIVLFSTNFIENFDRAFMSRIQYHVEFKLPDINERKKLWQLYIPKEMPAKIDYDEISEKYSGISGRNISTAVFQAANKAAMNEIKEIPQEFFEEAIEAIQKAEKANKGNYETTAVKTEKVSREYVVNQLGEDQVQKLEEAALC